MQNDRGKRRVRVEKGTEKIEGWWKHLKHGTFGVPGAVHALDRRLNIYLQAMAWQKQLCGDPFREVLRMCRAFHGLARERKTIVWRYGLTVPAGPKDPKQSPEQAADRKVCWDLPDVTYLHWNSAKQDDEDDDGAEVVDVVVPQQS